MGFYVRIIQRVELLEGRYITNPKKTKRGETLEDP